MNAHALPQEEMGALLARWRAAWPAALACWSRYTRLHEPQLCATTARAAKAGLEGSFAMIRLADQSVVIDLQAVHERGLHDYGVEILAHEIGHHVLAPATATDHFRMLARLRRVLGTEGDAAPMVANLYTDLCINDRLQRQAGLRMAEVYRKLARAPGSAEPGRVWTLYLRIYEHLWRLPRGSLGGGACEEALDADAWLGARIVRVYANEPMVGASRFAALLLPYLVEDGLDAFAWHDTGDAAAGCAPGSLHELEDDGPADALHPAWDTRLTGAEDAEDAPREAVGQGAGQALDPYEYGEILRAGGTSLSPHEIAMRYYRERALPHLVPFPVRADRKAPDPQMEGVQPWSIGDPLDEIDWLHSVTISPRPVPGVTLVRRVYSLESADDHALAPVDLDLYVDSSGSMPDPQHRMSWLALAGAIIALSALRTGASVQATLWSGKQQVLATKGFTRDADQVLHVLTGFFGGGTCFPIHRLRETYAAGRRARRTHILMISDDGITTMFDKDERGNSGWDVAARALAAGKAGGTMALDLPAGWDAAHGGYYRELAATLERARREQGWDIHAVPDQAGLLAFAQAFSRRHYAQDTQERRP
ncbi:VWA domain-containing protein [Massilia sp. G4R7]|uniref:VWA domain-containing protein n=1 Tax=Massilia phyllostachyos TaxID=2898585 RepID=A0ABS8QE23_9BURK|nr:VWA domain-containing protein [Massilia phyllostachyos]MCD2519020.1 VWA domain-containing protein [Massilia phyllostachyos]